MPRQNIASGAPWESIVGYSRAVRIGNHIAVTGTIAVDEQGAIVGAGDPKAQTTAAIRIIEKALNQAWASLNDVIRTRMFVTDIEHWQAIGEGHRECFSDIRPATTMVQVARLITDEALVEIEADAIVEESEQ